MKKLGSVLISLCVLLFLNQCNNNSRKHLDKVKASTASSSRIGKPPPSNHRAKNKIWLIGIDGATWHVAMPLVLKGELPNIRKLMMEGSYGDLESLPIMCSPNIWTTIVTGKIPKKHGITYWTSKIPGSNIDAPINNSNRKVRALWNILTEQNYTVGTVGYWTSWPAEHVNGFVVTDHFSYSRYNKQATVDDSESGQTYPPELVKEIKHYAIHPDEIELETLQRFMKITKKDLPKNFSIDHNPINEFRMVYAPAATYEQVALELLPQYDPDFFAIYFQAVDIASHYFWKYMEPRSLDFNDNPKDDFNVSQEEIEIYGEVVREVYRFQDEKIGSLLEIADPDTTIIIVSDHGFGADRRKGQPTVSAEHRKDGLIIMKGPDIKKGYEIQEASVKDLTPTILALMGLPVARDMDGKVLVETITPEFLSQNPIDYINTYETTPYKPPAFKFSPISDEVMKSLVNIGYVSAGNNKTISKNQRSRIQQEIQPDPTIQVNRATSNTGQVNMFKGGWGLRNGEFDQPRGLAFDSEGNLYVSDFRNYRIQKFNSSGQFILKFGWESKGNKESQFNDAHGIAVDENDNVFVLDTWNSRIQEFDTNGNFIQIIKPGKSGLFASKGIYVKNDKIYIADTGNHRALIMQADGTVLQQIGQRGKKPGEFNNPCGIFVDDKNYIYIADPGNNRIQIFKPNGSFDRAIKVPPFRQHPYMEPYLVVSNGYIYMSHPHVNGLLKYTMDGKLIGRKTGFKTPTGIALHPNKKFIYVSDTFSHKIVKVKVSNIR